MCHLVSALFLRLRRLTGSNEQGKIGQKLKIGRLGNLEGLERVGLEIEIRELGIGGFGVLVDWGLED